MLTALQGNFTKINLRIGKLQREQEQSVSTAAPTTGQTMTEPEKSSDLGKTSAVMVCLGVG